VKRRSALLRSNWSRDSLTHVTNRLHGWACYTGGPPNYSEHAYALKNLIKKVRVAIHLFMAYKPKGLITVHGIAAYTIDVKNDSQYSGRKLYVGKKAWDWTIYIDSEPSVLQNILRVTYQLHPTFTDPIKIIREPGKTSKAFPYSTTGWGTFNVGVRIEFKDGSELTTNHYLVFRE